MGRTSRLAVSNGERLSSPAHSKTRLGGLSRDGYLFNDVLAYPRTANATQPGAQQGTARS